MYVLVKYFLIIVEQIFFARNLEISESDVVCGPERSVILNHRLCYVNVSRFYSFSAKGLQVKSLSPVLVNFIC